MQRTAYRTWTSPDGLIGVEIDATGAWLRTRQHPADMWEAPIEMLLAGGTGYLKIKNGVEDNTDAWKRAGVNADDTARDGTPILARDDEGRAI
jgi:hypothetical protein